MYNHTGLQGRLTADPELRYTQQGTAITSFTLASDTGRKTKDGKFQSTRPLRGGTAILYKKTVQNIAYCTKSAFTLAVLSGFLALMRPFFCQTCTNFGANLPKNRCSLPVRTLIPSGPPPADSRH